MNVPFAINKNDVDINRTYIGKSMGVTIDQEHNKLVWECLLSGNPQKLATCARMYEVGGNFDKMAYKEFSTMGDHIVLLMLKTFDVKYRKYSPNCESGTCRPVNLLETFDEWRDRVLNKRITALPGEVIDAINGNRFIQNYIRHLIVFAKNKIDSKNYNIAGGARKLKQEFEAHMNVFKSHTQYLNQLGGNTDTQNALKQLNELRSFYLQQTPDLTKIKDSWTELRKLIVKMQNSLNLTQHDRDIINDNMGSQNENNATVQKLIGLLNEYLTYENELEKFAELLKNNPENAQLKYIDKSRQLAQGKYTNYSDMEFMRKHHRQIEDLIAKMKQCRDNICTHATTMTRIYDALIATSTGAMTVNDFMKVLNGVENVGQLQSLNIPPLAHNP
jgi:hypothetical protein